MNAEAPEPPYSVPRYPSGQPCKQAIHHVLVSQGASHAARADLYAALSDSPAQFTHLALATYPDLNGLHHAVLEQLRGAHVGLRLYLQGDEAFIWPLYALARDAGLQAEEIVLDGCDDGQRAVYCVHCASIQPGTVDDRLTCAHCGVVLEVRRHFSRRLGAYLGVCADADRPYAQVRP